MTTGTPGGRVAAQRRVRQRKETLLVDQTLLDCARQALGTPTETEAVSRALEAMLRREQQVEGIRALATEGPIDPTGVD
jgi:hypothetical protein